MTNKLQHPEENKGQFVELKTRVDKEHSTLKNNSLAPKTNKPTIGVSNDDMRMHCLENGPSFEVVLCRRNNADSFL